MFRLKLSAIENQIDFKLSPSATFQTFSFDEQSKQKLVSGGEGWGVKYLAKHPRKCSNNNICDLSWSKDISNLRT